MIEYDYAKLRGLIREKLKTEGAFAQALGRSHNFVSMVFQGETFFSHGDIVKACDLLGIVPEDIGLYFFTQKVHNAELNEV